MCITTLSPLFSPYISAVYPLLNPVDSLVDNLCPYSPCAIQPKPHIKADVYRPMVKKYPMLPPPYQRQYILCVLLV